MQYKTLATLLFVSLAVARPMQSSEELTEKSQEPWESSMAMTPTPSEEFTQKTQEPWEFSTPTSMMPIPSSYVNEILNALPPSVIMEMATQPAAIPSIETELLTKTQWMDQVPSSAQEWFSHYMHGTATGSSKTVIQTPPSTKASATSTSKSHATPTSSGKGSGSGSGSSNSTSSTTSSHNGVPAATANVAMNFAGVAGLLGVALVL